MDNTDDKQPGNNDQTEAQSVSPEKAAEAMKAFGEMMEGLGAKKREEGESKAGDSTGNIKIEGGQAGPLPEMMLNLFATAIQTAQAKQTSAKKDDDTQTHAEAENVVDLKTERAKRTPRQPTELEQKLQGNLKDTFQSYVDEKVAPDAEPGSEIKVDGAFLQEHGPALFGALLKSAASTVLPEDKQISIPVKQEGDKEPVKLKFDLNGIFNKLTNPPKKN